MGTVITTSALTIAPDAVTAIESARAAATIVHAVLGSPSPDITLRPATARAGRLEMWFTGPGGETRSKDAVNALSAAASFTLTRDDLTTLSMTFVVQGGISRALDTATRAAWIVQCEFQEVSP